MSEIPEEYQDLSWYWIHTAAEITTALCHGMPFALRPDDKWEWAKLLMDAVREIRATGKVKTDAVGTTISEWISGHDFSEFLKQKGITGSVGNTFERVSGFHYPSWCKDSHLTAASAKENAPEEPFKPRPGRKPDIAMLEAECTAWAWFNKNYEAIQAREKTEAQGIEFAIQKHYPEANRDKQGVKQGTLKRRISERRKQLNQ